MLYRNLSKNKRAKNAISESFFKTDTYYIYLSLILLLIFILLV